MTKGMGFGLGYSARFRNPETVLRRESGGGVTVVRSANTFEWRKNGGGWTQVTAPRPYAIPGILVSDDVDVRAYGVITSLIAQQTFTVDGATTAYSAGPVVGQQFETNLVTADTADYTPNFGTVTTVTPGVQIETDPDVFNIVFLDDATVQPFEPGDRITPFDDVVGSKGQARRIMGATTTLTLTAPVVTAQPVLPAFILDGTTTFSGNFGGAGPIGENSWFGTYTPSMTPILTINGANRASELTFLSGTAYTWSGAALSSGDVITAQASWLNATGTTLSDVVTVGTELTFTVSRNDLTYEALIENASGVVTGTVTTPAPYSTYIGPDGAGAFSVDSDDLATGPVIMFPPVIQFLTGTYSVLQEPIWTSAVGATGFTATGQWKLNGSNVSGQTSLTYSGTAPSGGQTLRYDAAASDSNGTVTVQSNGFTIVGNATVALVGANWSTLGSTTAAPSMPTIDLSAYGAGDKIAIVYGPGRYASACTVGGVDAPKISDDLVDTASARLSVFEYELTGAGSAATTIAFTLPSSSNSHAMRVLGIIDGQIAETPVITQGLVPPGTNPISGTATPGNTTNDVYAFVIGSNATGAFTTGTTWTGLTKVLDTTGIPGTIGGSVASGVDVTTPIAVTVSRTPADRNLAMAIISVTGV